jgi:hypothetical protein
MARLKGYREAFHHISEVGVFRDTSGGGSSTIASAPPVKGALTVVTAASGTGFATGDWVRMRSLDNYPEINQGSWATAAFTPYMRWMRAGAVGDAMVEQTKTPLGHIEASGVSVRISAAIEEVPSATRRLIIGRLLGNMKVEVNFAALGFTAENILASLGMLDTSANITGAGSSTDTTRAFINGALIKEQNNLCWYVDGTRKDGRSLSLHFYGCEIDYTKLRLALARGKKVPVPFCLYPTHGMRWIEID